MAIHITEAQARDDLVQSRIILPGVRIELCAFPEVVQETVLVTEREAVLSLGLSRLLAGSEGRIAAGRQRPFVRFGALSFRPAGVPMEMRVTGGAFHTLRCRFDAERIDAALGTAPLGEAALAACFDIRSAPIEEAMLRLAVEADQPQEDSAALAAGLVAALLVDLKRHLAQAQTRAQRERGGLTPRMLRRVLDRVDAEGPPPDIEALARLCGLSRFHFMRSFRATMGSSPGAFIRQARMTRAKALLAADERRPLADIALALGYSGASAFCTAFRQEVGQSPAAYRALMR